MLTFDRSRKIGVRFFFYSPLLCLIERSLALKLLAQTKQNVDSLRGPLPSTVSDYKWRPPTHDQDPSRVDPWPIGPSIKQKAKARGVWACALI